jgi:(3,5-dihydroxyphenyl)acetyl-CoA 1,2-dioxygenase
MQRHSTYSSPGGEIANAHTPETTLNAWFSASPRLCNKPWLDIRLLASHVNAGDALLSRLPPKPQRSVEQTRRADVIHKNCRALRNQFLTLHAEWVYDALTDGCTIPKGLTELAFGAAELCPGLVPTPAQIEMERTHPQAEKEGYEIDQGLLFSAFLRSPRIAEHLLRSTLHPTTRAQNLVAHFRADGQLDLGSVLIERRGSAAHLTVNNAHCLNAEDDRLVDDLETAVDLALLDDEVRVGVLRGGVMTHPRYVGRRVFSAGINLKALHAGQISFVSFLLRRELGFISKIYRGILVKSEETETADRTPSKGILEKPWVAAVDSFAIGGGAQLLLVFDRVIAAGDSYFSLPAAQEGIVPGFANLRLNRHLGSRKARQMILFGDKIRANDPDASLVFDEVVDSVDLDAAIARSVEQLSSPAVIANRHMLNLLEEPLEEFRQYAAEFALVQAERLYSPDVLAKINHR